VAGPSVKSGRRKFEGAIDMKLLRASPLTLLPPGLLLFAVSLFAQQPVKAQSHQPKSFAATIAQLQKDIPDLMHQADVPGLAIAIVRNGKPAWQQNFGVKNSKTNQPVSDDTIFEAASLSKPVFTYAVLKLVDQGKLGLDVPLSTYLPKPYIENDDRLSKITARIVLSHRTGFPNWRNDGPLTIKFTPGERFSYSGEGFVYLQTVVAQITGKPLNDLMNELVFTPLGMASSSYIWRSDFDARTAYGHGADAKPGDLRKDDHFNAAASLNTTAHDYALFLAAIVNGTGIQPATRRQMETPQIAVDPECTNCTDRTPKELSKTIFWGLGWGIQRDGNSAVLWHWGDNGDFKCFVLADPGHKSAVIMFTDSENGLAIAPAIFREATGSTPLAFSWIKYDAYDSDSLRFAKAVRDHGADTAMQEFAAPLKNGAISENSLNSLGYRLLSQKRFPEAIRIFQLNTELHPDSANTYDSLAEAYMNSGNNPLAIQFYEKSLSLNPKNENAVTQLKKLRHPPPDTTNP
jgi:CubicO group peptidase (beta-lactamase class C family)